jgi:FkbM family methyltransferase
VGREPGGHSHNLIRKETLTVFSLKEVVGDGVPNLTIVDIGAMIEGRNRYDILTGNYPTTVTGFEPNENEYARLCRSADASRRYLPYFIGDGREATFHVARYPGCSSLYEPDETLIDLFVTIAATQGGNFEIVEKRRVQTRRLDDVYDLPSAHFIKLDVQGSELDILRNATRTLQSTLVVESEVEFVPLYKGQPLFGDIQSFLKTQGFLLHKLIDVAGRCFRPFQMPNNAYLPLSQMLWADAVFVRDFTRLSQFDDPDLLRSAAILHDVYCSYDLVYLLLSAHDERNHTTFKEGYLKKVSGVTDLPISYLNQKSHP